MTVIDSETHTANWNRRRPGALVLAALVLLVGTLSAATAPAAAAASTVDLKVLVISVGDPAVDPGLDLMDDLLDELGVPYDVLDSSTTDLTTDYLRTGDHGRYNGIIVTVADTYLPGVGGAGLAPAEWTILHDYERDFDVNESVLAGWPATGGTPNYGMTNMLAATGTTGTWTPAAATSIFTYAEQSNPLSITDFGFSAAGRGATGDPVVTPYLEDSANPGNALVSHLAYDDGREVLLSTISNAWFLEYSQVLAYGFLDFATSGLHLGARRVHLSAHIDDLFISADRWDPVANVTTFDDPYRNTPDDIATTVAAQNAFDASFGTVDGFKVDLAFNGVGAGTGEATTATAALDADTYLDQRNSTTNYSASKRIRAREHPTRDRNRHALMQFTLPADTAGWQQATLGLRVSTPNGSTVTAKICAVTETWVAAEADWTKASAGTDWSTGGGAVYDAGSCIDAPVSTGQVTVDVSPIVSQWIAGSPNHGLVVRTENRERVNIWSAETNNDPSLTLSFGGSGDPLVDAVQANAASFRFLNHTFTHRDMDASAGTTQAESEEEIELNRQIWTSLGLPGAAENLDVVVTGNHSGLEDDNGTELDLSDDIHYPDGINAAMIAGFETVGIKYVASDTSRINTDTVQYVPGTDIVMLPRYPTSVFYNTLTPAELVDEYNYIFHERHIEAGEDPCAIPGAICTPRTYGEILEAEADTAVRHMLTYNTFPHYFHIANLVDYDGQGSTLLFDWLNAVVAEYETRMNLPIVNLPYDQIGDQSRDALVAEASTIEAVLNLQSGEVTLSASQPVDLEVTGLAGGAPYGAKLLTDVSLDTNPITLPAAP